jgi:hypothetical protein
LRLACDILNCVQASFSYGFEAPVAWYDLPEAERDHRAMLAEEQCEIDSQHFFVRGRICIPVHDGPHDFEWGVWVSLSARNYERMLDLWQTPGREAEPPYFGWLSSVLPGYPSTLNLKTMVHTRPVGERPTIELEPTDHPLAVEQRHGITVRRVQEIAEMMLHGRQLD